MRLLVIILLACQILFSNSEELYSTLSCILGRSNIDALIDHEQQLGGLFNATDNNSLVSKIQFWLYTTQYPTGNKIIFKNEQSLKESGFKSNTPTRICTHGFGAKGSDDSCMDPVKEFLSKGEFNVIIMDWFKYQSSSYFRAVKQVKPVALHLAQMINFLDEHGMNTSTTSLFGTSLGAHIVGVAGFLSKSQINHVVGIDPAEPMFINKGPGERISIEDAAHVEIIHSNAGHCGIQEAIGHYDFYVNGGSKQPGCSTNSCSHNRCSSYYIESITSSLGFYGRLCNDSKNIEKEKCTGEIALMGGLTRVPASPGIYFVETNDESPYAKGCPSNITIL